MTTTDLRPATAVRSTTSFGEILAELSASVLVSTYNASRLILVSRTKDGAVNARFTAGPPRPMGLAAEGDRLVIGSRLEVTEYRDVWPAAEKVEPAGSHDAAFLPRSSRVTGDVSVHDVGIGGDGRVWIVATRFSCLATVEGEYSFVPRWRPPFVSALKPDDRCHLNGLAMVDGRPGYASAFAPSDTPEGWRAQSRYSGLIADVQSDEIVAGGLCMPHSPRWHDGRLWVLLSGRGELAKVDARTGTVDVIGAVPGFARGLAFAGRYAFVGLSRARESIFDGAPIRGSAECGVWVVDTETGDVAARVVFDDPVTEIGDVTILCRRHPAILNVSDEITRSTWVLP